MGRLPATLHLDDVLRIWLPILGRGAVVAERLITRGNNGLDALLLGALNEAARIWRIAHQSVEDRSKRLRRG